MMIGKAREWRASVSNRSGMPDIHTVHSDSFLCRFIALPPLPLTPQRDISSTVDDGGGHEHVDMVFVTRVPQTSISADDLGCSSSSRLPFGNH